MTKESKVDFEKPYPDEEKMRRGILYWQNAPSQAIEDKCKWIKVYLYWIMALTFLQSKARIAKCRRQKKWASQVPINRTKMLEVILSGF